MKDQLVDIPKVLDIRVPLRSRIFTLVLLLSVGLISLYMITEIPKYGMWLGRDLLGLKAEFLRIRLSKQLLSYPLYFIAALSFGKFLYTVIYLKMLKFKANEINFIYEHGVFTSITDSMNMVDIRDQQERATLVEKMLGLSSVIISGVDKSHPELVVKGVERKDAKDLMIFLNNYAFKNYTDYRIKRDLTRDQDKESHRKDYIAGSDAEDVGDE